MKTIETTKSICPECKKLLDAEIYENENKVIMKKSCEDHGLFQCLLSTDAERYKNAAKFNKPGLKPQKFLTEKNKGCPYDCGLCTEHLQHSCVGIIEITSKCNLACPVCFASSLPNKKSALGIEKIEELLDKFIEYEGYPDVVQFSGGEPTIHPDIIEILRMAKRKNIKMVMINSNGKRIAEDEDFVKELSKLGASVYLQFDGFKRETHIKIRGIDMRETKRKALENLNAHKVDTALVATIEKYVNDDEIGELTKLALNTTCVKGIVFQPAFFCGRHPTFDPMDRMTLTDVIDCIEKQTRIFTKTDFYPIPCCYPTCSTATFGIVNNGETIPITKILDVEEYLDYFKNKIFIDMRQATRNGLEGMYSMSSLGNVKRIIENYCQVCNIQFDTKLNDKIKMILVQPFMDAWNFDVKKVQKCCVHEIASDGKIIPFCAYNPIYRELYENKTML